MPGFSMVTVIPLAAAVPTAQPYLTFGKAGVDYNRYRDDARECGMRAVDHDMRQEKPTERFLQWFDNRERNLNMPRVDTGDPNQAMVIQERNRDLARIYNPDGQVADLQTTLVTVVESCLIDRGYSRIALTDPQTRTLQRYPKGSDGRRRYLHSLASDARVVAGQVAPVR